MRQSSRASSQAARSGHSVDDGSAPTGPVDDGSMPTEPDPRHAPVAAPPAPPAPDPIPDDDGSSPMSPLHQVWQEGYDAAMNVGFGEPNPPGWQPEPF